MRIPFAVASYRHRVLPISAQRLINLMEEPQAQGAKAQSVLLPTPGLSRFALLPTGPWRGAATLGADLYAVSGTGVYRVDVNGAVTVLGNIADGGAVSMDTNATQVGIVVPETGQAWFATASTLTQITDPDFDAAAAMCVIDGYGIFVRKDSTEFFLSAINDFAAYDALDFASAEAASDNILTCKRVGRDLWLFGERTLEIWNNVGTGDFPFLRVNGGVIERGCLARDAVSTIAGVAFWIGNDRVAYQSADRSPNRISDYAIEQAWAGYATVEDVRTWCYELEGHIVFVVSFPTEGETWVYDATARKWHERESEGYLTWRCVGGTQFAGGVVAGDARDGRLYLLNPVAMDEDGETIIRVATGVPLHSENRRLFFRRLDVEMQTGVGLVAGQGSDPKVWLSFSDDGGRTWSNERWASSGKLGVYRTRVEFRRLGQGRDRVFRLQWSDPVFHALIAANFEAEPASS